MVPRAKGYKSYIDQVGASYRLARIEDQLRRWLNLRNPRTTAFLEWDDQPTDTDGWLIYVRFHEQPIAIFAMVRSTMNYTQLHWKLYPKALREELRKIYG